jgi:hypothetical protein
MPSHVDELTFKHTYTKAKVKLSLCLINKHYALKAYGGVDIEIYIFLDLSTSCSWVASFKPLPLYPQGKSPRYPFDRRLGGPRAGLDDVEKRKFLTPPGLEIRPFGLPARSWAMPCSPIKVNRRFGGIYRLHLQDWRVRKSRNKHEAGRVNFDCYPREQKSSYRYWREKLKSNKDLFYSVVFNPFKM